MKKKIMWVMIKDAVDYSFNPAEYSEEEAKQQAWEWFNERKPEIKICYDEIEEREE